MKKFILIFISILCAGCGKKLTCTYKEAFEDIKINNKIVFNLSNNTYKKIDTMVFSDINDASNYFKDIEEYADEYNLILDKNKIVSNTSGNINNKINKKQLKKQYENYDYKCN